jgi:hypothetical protein
MEDLTEEEKKNAALQAALENINEFNKKQEALKDGYECGLDESVFDEMHSKHPKRNDPHNLLEQQMVSFLILLEAAQLLEIISEDFNTLMKSELNLLVIKF